MRKVTLVICLLAASIVSGGITAYTVNQVSGHNGSSYFASEEVPAHFTSYQKESYPDLTYAAENAVQAVVNIAVKQQIPASQMRGGDPFSEFFGMPRQQQIPQERQGGGSGVIISEDGYIVTNNHVVEHANEVKVTLNDKQTFVAKVIGTDPTTDIALIKVEAKGLPTLSFGDSDALRLGEWVLAIGSPYGLQSTITAGIVSAKARSLNVIPSQFSMESFIQTDAAVNPGNSGGALVNTNGDLMGINTVIKSPTGSFAGYSFAVPTSIVQKVVVDLKEFGVVQRAMLGISFQEINDQFMEHIGKEKGIKEKSGIYVATVDPQGAAKAAGIREGDVIVEVNGIPMNASSKLFEQIAKQRPNDKMQVSVKRDGELKQFEVVLRNKSGNTGVVKRDSGTVVEELGGTFSEIPDKIKSALKIQHGIQITGIEEVGVLSQARIRKGYIITHINEKPIRSISDLSRLTEKVASIDGIYPDGRAVSYSLIAK